MRPPILRTPVRQRIAAPLRSLAFAPRRIPHPRPIPSDRSIHHTAVRLNAVTSPKAKQCPSCSSHLAPSASPCPTCKSLVPIPSDVSYYALFDLVPPASDVKHELSQLEGGGYVVDVRDLRMRYLKRQQGCHPDSYTGQGKIYDLALEQSSFLNKAYSTLVNPLSRAQYLLEIYGNPIAETDSLDDPALLMDVMEAREELEEAETEEEVERVKASNAEHIQEAMRGLAEAFGRHPPDLTRAKALAIEMQYLQNLERAAREWQPGKRVEVVH
ncbi:hypothetical protein NliqN6_2414 [Naganishia liquefaciens]|uniref:Co-chaperone HscB C-terminal oligomerisation domain-containing protein n=1 Tax=Naganishia liquefaciens TaxID=104408 RepID=A0A8H3TRQ9_9TREE|nr:hypothetical protein NliqN6_2414 [Naganishia liquefaciens]